MWASPHKAWTTLLVISSLATSAWTLDAGAAALVTERSDVGVTENLTALLLDKRGRHRATHHRASHRPRPHKHTRPHTRPHHVKSQNRFSSNTYTHVGDATFFTVGLGACGQTNSDHEYIAAASHFLYDSYPGATRNPNNNPICGRRLRATYGGVSIIVKIVDRCQACKEWDLDFSPSAFKHLEDQSAGRLHGMSWTWIDDGSD